MCVQRGLWASGGAASEVTLGWAPESILTPLDGAYDGLSSRYMCTILAGFIGPSILGFSCPWSQQSVSTALGLHCLFCHKPVAPDVSLAGFLPNTPEGSPSSHSTPCGPSLNGSQTPSVQSMNQDTLLPAGSPGKYISDPFHDLPGGLDVAASLGSAYFSPATMGRFWVLQLARLHPASGPLPCPCSPPGFCLFWLL